MLCKYSSSACLSDLDASKYILQIIELMKKARRIDEQNEKILGFIML